MSCGNHLDLSISALEETRFKAKHKNLIQKLSRQVHFSYTEIESLLLIYEKLRKASPEKGKELTKHDMKHIMHNTLDMTDYNISDKLVSILDFSRTSPNSFSMSSWVKALSLLLRGTLEEKIKYCYSIYDLAGTGKITRNSMIELLHNSIIADSPEEAEDCVKDLTEVLHLKIDLDRDGKISFEDYKQTVLNYPLYLEAFGCCLPSRLSVRAFLSVFTANVGNIK